MSNLIYMEKEDLREIITETLHDKFDEIRLANPSPREVMTLAETAEHFRVSKQSILNWVKNKSNPFPVHYFGSEPRFFLYEVREWSRNNAERKLK